MITKAHLIQFSINVNMSHQQPINICHINTYLVSAATSLCMVKNFKIIYLTHIILILNFIFTVVFYPMR
jgi:hypothetical protein